MATMKEYKAFLAQVRKLTGLDVMVPDETGLMMLRVEDRYNLNLQFVEATGKVLCFVEVAELPKDAPKAVYRDLLVGGLFGKETAGGYFTLEPQSETLIYNYFFDLAMAARDIEDFVATLEKILQLCDMWFDRIHGLLGEGHEAKADAPKGDSPHDFIALGHTIIRP